MEDILINNVADLVLTEDDNTSNDKRFLIYIDKIGCEPKNEINLYSFYFSTEEQLPIVWGQFWEDNCPLICGDITPESETYVEKRRLASNLKLGLACKQTCFSMQDCIDGVIPLCWEDISDYESYPDNGRLIIPFGTEIKKVELLLINKHQHFEI